MSGGKSVLLESAIATPPKFVESWFENCEEVRIGFRLQMKSADHWVNKAAIALTRKRSDRYPGGHLCHAELMMQATRGRWYRISIVKKSCKGKDATGRMQWLKGTVHCKSVNTASWDAKYRFLNINIPREQQVRMWRCLECQINAPFNFVRAPSDIALCFLWCTPTDHPAGRSGVMRSTGSFRLAA